MAGNKTVTVTGLVRPPGCRTLVANPSYNSLVKKRPRRHCHHFIRRKEGCRRLGQQAGNEQALELPLPGAAAIACPSITAMLTWASLHLVVLSSGGHTGGVTTGAFSSDEVWRNRHCICDQLRGVWVVGLSAVLPTLNTKRCRIASMALGLGDLGWQGPGAPGWAVGVSTHVDLRSCGRIGHACSAWLPTTSTHGVAVACC